MKISQWVLMFLMDKKQRKVSDLMPFLLSKIPPEVAIRLYTSATKGSKNAGVRSGATTIESKLFLGKRRALAAAIGGMLDGSGSHKQHPPYITVNKNESNKIEDWIIQITEEGLAVIDRKERGRVSGGAIWKALKDSYKANNIKLFISLPITHSEKEQE